MSREQPTLLWDAYDTSPSKDEKNIRNERLTLAASPSLLSWMRRFRILRMSPGSW